MKAGRYLCLLWLLAAPACHRQTPAQTKATPPPFNGSGPAHETPVRSDFEVNVVRTQEGEATWYDVPEQSLPQRRAWTQELTAASDVLPQESYARVRRLDGQGKEVIVRITDRGVHHRGALLDVSHAAAEALDIVRSGTARVRVETLTLRNASADKPVEKKDAPVAPKITGTPAVDQHAEKAAAEAKAEPPAAGDSKPR